MSEMSASQTPPRRLTLVDLMLMIGSTALALEMVRQYVNPSGARVVAAIWRSGTIGRLLSPFLITTSVALVIGRFRAPRPGLREAVCQPGTFACMAILADRSIQIPISLSMTMPPWIVVPPFGHLLFQAAYCGHPIAIGWATLALAGQWRPEPGWIDRSGRALGIAAMAVDLLARILP